MALEYASKTAVREQSGDMACTAATAAGMADAVAACSHVASVQALRPCLMVSKAAEHVLIAVVQRAEALAVVGVATVDGGGGGGSLAVVGGRATVDGRGGGGEGAGSETTVDRSRPMEFRPDPRN